MTNGAKPFLIANPRVGLERDIEPEILPNDAYPTLEDCYMFRGRIQRRNGFTELGRLVQFVDGEAVGTVVTPWTSFSGTLANTNISPGSVEITVGALTFFDTGSDFGDTTGTLITSPLSGNNGTIDYVTGAFTLTFSPALGGDTPVTVNYEFYDLLPVMGVPYRVLPQINEEEVIAFDTRKANVFSNVLNRFVDITFHKTTGSAFSWTGSDSDFFWRENYANAFWATNNIKGVQANPTTTNPVLGDGIRWYDGTGWVNFYPKVDGTNFLMGALMIFTYRGRLLMLNTTEGTALTPGNFTNYAQRARWSQNGTPYSPSGAPVAAGYTGGAQDDAWRSDIVGRGGYIDAPVQEEIISAQFYKDTLIVFFERTTWELRYTGNETLPFLWYRVNVDFGAESTFSIVPFDAGIIAVGNYGIVSCDATGVQRIDLIIPDEVFNIHNDNDGVKRVYGIRDYTKQLVYWTFPSAEENGTFPNRVLVYNYLDSSFSFFNDSFTCFGTYEPFNDTTWADLKLPWEQFPYKWDEADLQSGFPLIIAGNQQGYVFKDINDGPVINGTPSLYITNITIGTNPVVTSPNHNLQMGQVIVISGVNGMTQVNGNIYRVSAPITANTFSIQTLVDEVFVYVDTSGFGAYTNGGQITVRNSISILSKRFNPYMDNGIQLRSNIIDFLVQGTTNGNFTVNMYADENDDTPTQSLIVSTATSTGQEKVWSRIYPNLIAQFIQFELTFSNDQLFDPDASDPEVVIYAMMPWFAPAGRLIYGRSV